MTSHFSYFATAPKYTESLLVDELHAMGITTLRETVGGVHFNGSIEDAYRVCLWSRIANRVLFIINTEKVSDTDSLYDQLASLPWQDHFSSKQTIAVDFVSSQSFMQHSQYGAQLTKDAIVDYFRHHCGERPSVDKHHPDIRINVFIKKNQSTISIDLSGDSLHMRGYRRQAGSAPLKENIAAALLMRAQWPKIAAANGTLVDPMCGAGTLLIEAAGIAADLAPGLSRARFGFMQWLAHDIQCWNSLKEEAEQRMTQGLTCLPLITGSDHDQKMVTLAEDNILNANLEKYIKVSVQNINTLTHPADGVPGLVITNPPYGERLGDKEFLHQLYAMLGAKLAEEFTDWKACILTSDKHLAQALNIRARKINKLYNGNLLCQAYHFDLSRPESTRQPDTRQPNTDSDKAHVVEPELDHSSISFLNRLKKNIAQRNKWATKNDIHCYRLYDADIPEFSFAIDLYQSDKLLVHLQEYAPPKQIDPDKARQRIDVAISIISSQLSIPIEQIHYKLRKRQSGTSQYQKMDSKPEFHVVEENGCKFNINLKNYLDSGLFLDHRITRKMIQQESRGKQFLNLFCYTGTASVCALSGGAEYALSVDLSRTYLDWAERNCRLNGINQSRYELINADCIEWVKSEKRKFDLIFIDPPSFSNSKKMDKHFDIQNDHANLIKNCKKLLTDDGYIIFSTNFRKFKLDNSLDREFRIKDVTRDTIPEDFSRNQRIHHCWYMHRIN